MLANKLSGAIGVIEQYSDLQTRASQKRQLKSSIDTLQNSMVQMSQIVKQFQILKKANTGFEPTFDASTMARIRKVVQDCKTGVAKQNIRLDNLTEFSQLTVQMQEHLKSTWLAYVKIASHELIQSLKVMTPLLPNPERAKQIHQSLTNASEKWPVGTADLVTFVNNTNEGRNLIASLDVNKEVRKFLDLVVAGNATITDLNDQVLVWIRTHKLQTKMTIGFR